MDISATAWAAGMAGALLYLIFAWPLAKLFSFTRIMFVSFQMKLIAALALGVASAPLGEVYAPFLRDKAQTLIAKSDSASETYNWLASRLSR
ncbi:MAG: hypothetical protein CMK09_17950 [Ponticaulis sp.]|nr:hypothetical protein [Ponticaulis sp.]|tara:strand:+ start:18892 stop:19167 length:276 start_codon:yes stop_codon:yes gene_type:complete